MFANILGGAPAGISEDFLSSYYRDFLFSIPLPPLPLVEAALTVKLSLGILPISPLLLVVASMSNSKGSLYKTKVPFELAVLAECAV